MFTPSQPSVTNSTVGSQVYGGNIVEMARDLLRFGCRSVPSNTRSIRPSSSRGIYRGGGPLTEPGARAWAPGSAPPQQNRPSTETELIGERLPELSIACTVNVLVPVTFPYVIHCALSIWAPSKTPLTRIS